MQPITSPGKPENPARCYKIQLIDDRRARRRPDSKTDRNEQSGKPLVCSNCRAPITDTGQAVEKNGSHEHAFFNPAGIAFEIRCFRRAPGCLVQGEPTTEFSWFAGYSWQYGICAQCDAHLGWFFISDTDSFFGLMTNRVI